jgi:RNA polymerase sigma-70 factor (ECF subfamily)
MYRIAFRMVGSDDAALDVVQAASLKAWQKKHTFNGHSTLGSWLFRITVNAANDYLRSHRQAPLPLDAIAWEQSRSLRKEKQDDGMENRELYLIAMKQIEALPDDCRETFLLSQLDGYSYRHISEILEIPIGTVASRVHRAKQILIRELEKHW